MVDVEVNLRAELADIVIDFVELYNLSLELQFRGKALDQYNYWTKHAISYTILAREALGATEKYRWPPYEIDNYAGIEDLRELTKRLSIGYQRIMMAYSKEAGDELNQILSIITWCIAMMKAAIAKV